MVQNGKRSLLIQNSVIQIAKLSLYLILIKINPNTLQKCWCHPVALLGFLNVVYRIGTFLTMSKGNMYFFTISPWSFPHFLEELLFSFSPENTVQNSWCSLEHLSYMCMPKTTLLIVAPSCLFYFLPLVCKLIFTGTQESLNSNL